MATRPPRIFADKNIAPMSGLSRTAALYETYSDSAFASARSFRSAMCLPAHQERLRDSRSAAGRMADGIPDDGREITAEDFAAASTAISWFRARRPRTPLTIDPAARAPFGRALHVPPSRSKRPTAPISIRARSQYHNSPQSIDTDNAGAQLDQLAGRRDRFALRYSFVHQQVDAFELMKGQNPDTTTKSHSGRLTWEHNWGPATDLNASLGFDRLPLLLVPPPGTIGPSVSFSGVIDPLEPSSTLPIDRVQNRYRYAALLRRVHGHHLLTFRIRSRPRPGQRPRIQQ